MSFGFSRELALAAVVAAGAACSQSDATIEYEPYSGPAAYPDKRPKLPKPKGTFAFTSDNGSDTVTVLDVPSNEVVAQVPVGRDPVNLDGPHHLAVDAAGFVYVALSYPMPTTLPGPHAAHSASIRPGYVLKLAPDDLRAVGQLQIDPNPGEIVLSPDGTKLVVTHFDLVRAFDPNLKPDDQRATLVVIDPSKLAMVGSPPPISVRVCRAPHGASISPDSRTAYVACYADNEIAIVDLAASPPAVSLVAVGSKGPYSAVLSPSGKVVAVGSTDSKDTKLLDTQARAMKPLAIVTQGAPYFAAWSADDAKLWIPTQAPDALVLADAATGAVQRQRAFDAATCAKPHEAVMARDGATLYLVCEGDHVAPGVVLALDPATLDTKSTMKVGVYPDRIAFGRGP
jgi:YVTN family beta-propeller protein